MQSTPTLKDTDPHDVFAIESLLHAHAEKAPPLAHDPAAPPAAPQVHVTPPISASAPIPQVEPTFRAPDARDIQLENVRPSEIKVDGLKPLGERPMSKWVKRVVMALLGLCGAMAAAAWQHYGDQAKAMAAEWAPPFVLAALPSATGPAVAEQPSTPATDATATDQAAAQPAAAPAPAQPEPSTAASTTVTAAAPAPSAESAQLQSMAQDLATMGQQVDELKTTIAQLKASQAQMARELAKASEAKAAEARPAEQNQRPRVSALPPPRQAAPPPVRKPKPAYSSAPAPIAAAPAAPYPPAQAAAPLPPAPPQQTIADDGQPVVRPPMPLR
ncbi:hypothetical protein IVB22_37295 [Bradyrhizobium sp. 190]|uniref:hypothetical protein n=1 Tax=Bradyrhizobium sp. 190 TaxID=2782658 RepID=UPI001FF741DD|nr:hypothetical protein [Bradyrhizobium sp. 190]MCK1518042.1 hypothetical protein [Bradyrhizobium sp. 190]